VTGAQALVLGLVQGLTEFLPVSSSGHLVLVPVLLGWPDQGLAFDAVVHLATALALLAYFAGEIGRTARGVLARRRDDVRLALGVALATVPAGVAGLLFEDVVEARLRSATVVAASAIVWGLALGWADRRAERGHVQDLRQVGPARALLIGVAQALALVPGTSRSGITLTAGLALGLDRPTAARFGFLLGLPVTAAAGLLKTATLARAGGGAALAGHLGIGFLAAFAAGLVAVWFLVRYVRRRSLTVFVVYRLALGLLILWLA
jgi:undecaprenyl-diphosphatase